MDFGWTQREWFGDKLNCQKIKLPIMRPYAKHRPFIVILIKIGEHRMKLNFFEFYFFFQFCLKLLFFPISTTDSLVTIQISQPIMRKYQHSVNHRANAVAHVHQPRTRPQHWWATQD